MHSKTIHRIMLPAVAAACALASVTAAAKPLSIQEDTVQLHVDQTALQREAQRYQNTRATFQADRAAGRMTAVSPDELAVFKDKQALVGTAEAIAADRATVNPLQLKTDEATLKRTIRHLDDKLATLRADTEEGRMAATSKDAEAVYKERIAYAGEAKAVAEDKAELKTAQM